MVKRDLRIDCIKGIAILMVIMFHSMMGYSLQLGGVFHWEQAVPLFLFVISYIAFKKSEISLDQYFRKEKIFRLIKRIFVPFFIFQGVIVLVSLILHKPISLWGAILSGGLGFGSYYPWLYLQLWIALPFIILLLLRYGCYYGGGLLLLICIAIELLFGSINSSTFIDAFWRLSIGRYVFILYLSFLLAGKWTINDKVVLPKFYSLLIILSILFIFTDRYRLIELTPFFYSTKSFAWWGFHWPMYIYSSFIFVLLYNNVVRLPDKTINFFALIGRSSWEIFLSQMMFFYFFSVSDMPFELYSIQLFIFCILSFLFSFAVAGLYIKIKNNTIHYVEKLF